MNITPPNSRTNSISNHSRSNSISSNDSFESSRTHYSMSPLPQYPIYNTNRSFNTIPLHGNHNSILLKMEILLYDLLSNQLPQITFFINHTYQELKKREEIPEEEEELKKESGEKLEKYYRHAIEYSAEITSCTNKLFQLEKKINPLKAVKHTILKEIIASTLYRVEIEEKKEIKRKANSQDERNSEYEFPGRRGHAIYQMISDQDRYHIFTQAIQHHIQNSKNPEISLKNILTFFRISSPGLECASSRYCAESIYQKTGATPTRSDINLKVIKNNDNLLEESTPKTFWQKIVNFFRKIWNFLRSLFRSSPKEKKIEKL